MQRKKHNYWMEGVRSYFSIIFSQLPPSFHRVDSFMKFGNFLWTVFHLACSHIKNASNKFHDIRNESNAVDTLVILDGTNLVLQNINLAAKPNQKIFIIYWVLSNVEHISSQNSYRPTKHERQSHQHTQHFRNLWDCLIDNIFVDIFPLLLVFIFYDLFVAFLNKHIGSEITFLNVKNHISYYPPRYNYLTLLIIATSGGPGGVRLNITHNFQNTTY